MPNTARILRIDASARQTGSTTRRLADDVINRLADTADVQLVRRDVAAGLPFVNDAWVAANFTDADARTPEQRATLSLSDDLVSELEAADILVLATPIYNFGIPASLKAWIDLIARARKTFRYSAEGPVGLLTGKRAILVVASGGTAIGSEIDFAIPYLRHVLAFIGITDVEIIAADALGRNAEEKLADVAGQIANLQVS